MSEAARSVIAEASYANEMYVHNDPPLWDGPEEMTISDAECARYFEDADHIIKSLEKAGFQIVASTVRQGQS